VSGTPCKVSELDWYRESHSPRAECNECDWTSPYWSSRGTQEGKLHAARTGHAVSVVTKTIARYGPHDWTHPGDPS
jgi:hypothetical protein